MEKARERSMYEAIREEYGSQCYACKSEWEKCGNRHCSANKGMFEKKNKGIRRVK